MTCHSQLNEWGARGKHQSLPWTLLLQNPLGPGGAGLALPMDVRAGASEKQNGARKGHRDSRTPRAV